jgi:hypothetical protein
MRTELVAVGVNLRKLELRGDCLYVEYERKGELETDGFLLASVAALSKPLAAGAKSMEIVVVRGDRKLLDVTAPPETVSDIYAPDLSAKDKDRLAAMLARCMANLPKGSQAAAPKAVPAVPAASTATVAPAVAEGPTPVSAQWHLLRPLHSQASIRPQSRSLRALPRASFRCLRRRHA